MSAVDERGREILARRIDNGAPEFNGLLDALGEPLQVAVEATYGWEWLVEVLHARGCDVRLSHPLRTRAIATARVKTDTVDARTLAELLRADFLREAFIAPQELRDLRDLLRQRATLIRVRTALKNRVRGPARPQRPRLPPRRAVQRRIAERRGRHIANVALARGSSRSATNGLRDGEIRALRAGERQRSPTTRPSGWDAASVRSLHAPFLTRTAP